MKMLKIDVMAIIEFTSNISAIYKSLSTENPFTFNIKYSCEFTHKNKISTNHNCNLINNLIQNSALRYKILDILFVVWIVDSICLKDLIKLNPNLINQNNLLKNLNSIFLEGKLLEEFFYDDFDRK